MNRRIGLFLAAVVMMVPLVTLAAGLVPCGGPDEPACQACYFVELLTGLLDWLVGILAIVFALIVVTAGFKLVTSAGNTSAKETAKSMISNAIIGFTIVLAAWLLVDLGMKMLVSDEGSEVKLGVWNAVQCVDRPVVGTLFSPTLNQSSVVASIMIP